MFCSKCGGSVKPIWVSDIDGTLSDYHGSFARFAWRYWGMKVVGYEPWDGTGEFEGYLQITKAQYREAKLAFRQGGNKRWAPVYPGARELSEAVHEAGGEFWVATTRPWQRLDNIDPDTQWWLKRNGIEVDGLLYGDNKYDLLVEAVDKTRIVGVLDDLVDQYHKAWSHGLPAYLRVNDHNVTAPLTIQRINLHQAAEIAAGEIQEWRFSHAH